MASVNLQEKANFARLSRLLVDKGTDALRKIFDGIHSPASLPAVLTANRTSLLKLKPRVINDFQWDLLYPPSGNPPASKTFDVTLLTVLFRNICGLPSTGWGAMPVDTDRSVQANIVRIKSLRNEVYAHVTSTRVDNATFESLWRKISQILVELNIPQNDIDDLKTSPLWPEEEIYVEIFKYWKLQEEEYLKVLESLSNDVKSIESSINRLTEITEENRYGNRRNENDEELLRKLAKHNFKSKIRGKVEFFQPGTREWLLKKVDELFIGNKHESKILLLTAGPGIGKSVFAAKVCENFKKKGKLAACHFCDFSDSNLRNPMMMLQSLASQMCENVVGFKEKLLDQLKRPHEIHTLKDAFGIYLQNPLDELEVEEPSLVVIDGLDESAADRKNEIVDLIADYFPDLPECVKVLVTSRPEISLEKLKDFKNINIESKDADNNSDLKIYLKACLPNLHERKADSDSDVLKTLVEMCEGSFLYAFYTQAGLQKRNDLDKVTCDEIIKFVPKGLDSIYHAYFKRLEDELKAIMRGNLDVLRFLDMLVASEGTLPVTFVTKASGLAPDLALGLAPDCRETKNIINKVNEILSSLLYVSDDMVTVFHKSVIDWLLARGYQDHEYTVNVCDGNKSLWLICEQIFEEIKKNICSGYDLNLTNDVEYALVNGLQHLVACNMRERFSWLVDVVLIHLYLTFIPAHIEVINSIMYLWKDILRVDAVISDELRARISWHVVEIEYILKTAFPPMTDLFDISPVKSPYFYLQSVLTHSPKGYFSDNDKKIAKSILSKVPQFVDFNIFDEVEVVPLAVWCHTSTIKIKAVGVSKDKSMAAVAQKNGRISIVCVPRLVELWKYSTKCQNISCCTFSPDDSFVLFGKLEAVLSIAERIEVPFFHRNKEMFASCAFSPNGKRLVTSNGSSIKLWDVAKQRLLTLLCAEVPVNWCSFSSTGLFIFGDRKSDDSTFIYPEFPDYDNSPECSESDAEYLDIEDEESDSEDSGSEDSFCVWNAITWQRCDERGLRDCELEPKEGKALQSKLCKSCFRPGFEKLPVFKRLDLLSESREIPHKTWSTGIYNSVECIFYVDGQSLTVIENTHFTTLGVWNIFIEDCRKFTRDSYHVSNIFREITAIEGDLWLYVDGKRLIVFRTLVPTCSTRVLWSSFSPDGSRLATCTSDGCINIWNVDTRQVEQRFKTNQGELPIVCWWSEKFLFVFDFFDRIPNLSKYPVDVNLKILFSQSQQVSLCHLADEFVSLSAVVDFSEGFLCFECGRTKPVNVLDVNEVGRPRMVTLPGIEPMMNITVAPGASFVFGDKECREKIAVRSLGDPFGKQRIVFIRVQPMMYGLPDLVPGASFVGGDKNKYYIWKRNSEKSAVYEFFFAQPDIPLHLNQGVISCFSNDSKVVVIAYVLLGRPFVDCKIIDLVTGNHQNVSFRYCDVNSKLFCINKNRVFISASHQYIKFLDMDTGSPLSAQSSFQRYLTRNSLTQTRLSPDGTAIAFPKINGDMEFLRLSIPEPRLLCRIKSEAVIEATERNNFKENFFANN